MSKSLKVVSGDMVKSIREFIAGPCKEGEFVTLTQISKHLAEQFSHDSPSTFKVVAQLAIQHNQLPGYDMRRGRSGGVYHVATQEKLASA